MQRGPLPHWDGGLFHCSLGDIEDEFVGVGDRVDPSYIPEKQQKGQRNWAGKQAEQQAVYANRRRVRGEYGRSLLRRRGEFVERSFAHCYETGGMRRCHLRGRDNILKRQLIHVGAFNLSLVLRKLLGAGTPRELRNRLGTHILQVFLRLSRRNVYHRFCRSRICAAEAHTASNPRRRSGPHPSVVCWAMISRPVGAEFISIYNTVGTRP